MNANTIISRIIFTALAVCWAAVGTARATFTLTTLATFNNTNGQYPYSGMVLSGSTLYGTTYNGGVYNGSVDSYGTVFSVPLSGGSPTTLATFNRINGANPSSVLTLSGSTLYGTTQDGGANNDGTVFSLPLSGGSPTTLATFNSNSGPPSGRLTASGSTLYGTTATTAGFGSGTVFSVPLSGGSLTTLSPFYNTGPGGGLTLSGNTLYGMIFGGGASGNGSVFSVLLSGGAPTTLATFNYTNGSEPNGGLTLSGNTLYGMTAGGGASNDGTVFSVPIGGGSPTTLVTFSGRNGSLPFGGLILSGNTLYGETEEGGLWGDGSVFSVPVTGGLVTTLASFNGNSGTAPVGGLVLSGTTLYGTTRSGGANDDGTVFSVSTIPYPIISLTVAPPTAFGYRVGTLTSSNNHITVGSSTGYVAVNLFDPSTNTETYALEITDFTPANLATDLADAALEINSASYTGYSVTASTTDPLNILKSGYNIYITITNDPLGTGSPYFGFDFTQLNSTTDILYVSGVAAVPEPANLSLLVIGVAWVLLLGRRRQSVWRQQGITVGTAGLPRHWNAWLPDVDQPPFARTALT